MNWTDPKRLNHLFACIADEVMASGGDGSGVVVFKQTNIQEVANAFELWKVESGHPYWLPYRENLSCDHVLFSDRSNECVAFVSKAIADTWETRVDGYDEIWLEVW